MYNTRQPDTWGPKRWTGWLEIIGVWSGIKALERDEVMEAERMKKREHALKHSDVRA